MKYIRRPVEVEAVQMPEDFKVGHVDGKAGDWLILNPPRVMSNKEFNDEFIPLQIFMTPQVHEVTKAIKQTVREKPVVNPIDPEEFERTETQGSVMICMTCGRDVPISKVNRNRDCPECAANYPEEPVTPVEKKPKRPSKLQQILLNKVTGGPELPPWEEADATV
jgi:hypothetical protein